MPRLRPLLLSLLGLGTAGLAAELYLLEHWRVPAQWIPLSALALCALACAGLSARPTAQGVRLFRAAMMLVALAGLAGIGFHLFDNLALEREIAPGATGLDHLRQAARGATPLLAPGSLVQLGLLGLILTVGHPALRRESPTAGPEDATSREIA